MGDRARHLLLLRHHQPALACGRTTQSRIARLKEIMSDKAFEDLYAAALRASGSTGTPTTDAERRKRLREIVWDSMRTYGHGARHEEEGVRRVWGVKFK